MTCHDERLLEKNFYTNSIWGFSRQKVIKHEIIAVIFNYWINFGILEVQDHILKSS